jgi:hypothetical protein
MRQLLMERQEQDRPIDSARELYDLWIHACEMIYNEQVMTPEYSRVYGELVNALMAYKAHTSHIIDGVLGALNMPTQRELRTVHDRLQSTRRDSSRMRKEVAILQAEVDRLTDGGSRNDEIDALRKQLASMQSRLDGLAARSAEQAEDTSQAKTAPKKAAPKKRPAKKAAAKTGDTAGTA